MTPLERWAAVLAIRDLTGPQKAVLGALAFHAGESWPVAKPSLETLAVETGLSRATVFRALDDLDGRYLTKDSKHGNRVNHYRLMLPAPPSCVTATVSVCDGEQGTSVTPATSTDHLTPRPSASHSEHATVSVCDGEAASHTETVTAIHHVTVRRSPSHGEMPTVSRCDANKSINTKTPLTPHPAEQQLFDRFWTAFPKKWGKAQAKAAWSALCPDEALVETILAAIARGKRTVQWRKDSGQFVPRPADWLSDRRWEPTPQLSNKHSAAPLAPVTTSARRQGTQQIGAMLAALGAGKAAARS